MKLGLIARADNSGLGTQTHEFYKHMHPAKTMVVNISKYNNNKQYPERYPDGMHIYGFPSVRQVEDFLQGLDVVFIAEAAYNPWLYIRARELGIKTAVQYNYEFFDWFSGQTPMPDLFIAPSTWHYPEVDAFIKDYNVRNKCDIWHTYLHCPVNRELLPLRHIPQARTFLHVAGRAAAHDRNGTMTVIDAAQYLKTPAQIKIHFQGEQGLAHQATHQIGEYIAKIKTDNIEIIQNEFENYQDIYTEGDVLLLPRRYGGNCLPMNEALSVGMPVIMTNISPNNDFLPENWLVPAAKISQFTPRTTVGIYEADPRAIADIIDYMYNLTERDFEHHTRMADGLADTISWQALKPKYERIFEKLCNQ